jgi:hypothetical protein
MSDFKQMTLSRQQYCFAKKYHKLSSYPSRLSVTPGICAPPIFNCYERIPETSSALSIHIKSFHSEQIGAGNETTTQNTITETSEKNASGSDATNHIEEDKTTDKDLKTILYKMDHPVFHVKEEKPSETKEENGPKSEPVSKKHKQPHKFKSVKRPKIDYDLLEDHKPFRF